jgi:hypothetical protein
MISKFADYCGTTAFVSGVVLSSRGGTVTVAGGALGARTLQLFTALRRQIQRSRLQIGYKLLPVLL